MAIVPQKENFAVMPQGFSARMGGAPAAADVAGNARALGKALMAYDQAAEARDQVDAASDVNALAGFLEEKQDSLFGRKGFHAWQDENGEPVMEGINREVEAELERMRSGMSDTRREKFDAMAAPYLRQFQRQAGRYIQAEYGRYEDATLEETKAQYQKMALANAVSDPEAAFSALNDFHGTARYQALKGGADEALADGMANRAASGLVRGIVDEALERGDLDTAALYRQRYAPIMGADDLIAVNRGMRRAERIRLGEDFAQQAFSAGAADAAQGDGALLLRVTRQMESANRRYGSGGELVRSPKGALGEYQVMPDTAKDPGFGVRPAEDGSPDELARVGADYLEAMCRRYGGDLERMWGAYNAGPGTVDALVGRYGDDWLAHAPRQTQAYVKQGMALYRQEKGRPGQLLSAAEFALKAREAFGQDRQAYQAAVDAYGVRLKAFAEKARREQEAALITVYDMADAGRTATEIERSGLLDGLDAKNRRAAARYIRRQPVYDGVLAAALLDNPEALQQTDLRALRGEVSRPELEMLARRQAMGQTPDGRKMLEDLSLETKAVLAQNGLDGNCGEGRDAAVRFRLEDSIIRSVTAFFEEKRRYPADRERLEMIRQAVGEVAVPAFLKRGRSGKAGQDFAASLSLAEKKRVLAEADARGFKGTEDQRIYRVLAQDDGMGR